MDRAYDQISQYKVLHNIEKEIRTAQYMLKQSREQQVQTDKGKPDWETLTYLRRLQNDGEPLNISRKYRKELAVKDNTIENAMSQDLKDAGVEDNIKPDDSDDEEMKEMTSAERKRHKIYL